MVPENRVYVDGLHCLLHMFRVPHELVWCNTSLLLVESSCTEAFIHCFQVFVQNAACVYLFL